METDIRELTAVILLIKRRNTAAINIRRNKIVLKD